jgi:nucleoside 2-deoxyribosyltransferase
MKKDKIKIYLASPYGFTSAGQEFMKNIMIPTISIKGFEILNPWDSFDFTLKQIRKISSINDITKQFEMLRIMNKDIAINNLELLKQADLIIAVLDGSDVDSGVATEIGYAYANNKTIIGYRSDFRLSGDNLAALVNVQVEYFINESGGIIVNNITDLKDSLKKRSSSLTK